MIRTSRLVLWLCAGAALAIHGGGLWLSEPRSAIEIESGAGTVEVMLGSSFADMVAGAAQPVSNSTVTPNPRTEEVLRPTEPGEALRPDTAGTIAATGPREMAETAKPEAVAGITPPDERASAAVVEASEPVLSVRRTELAPAMPTAPPANADAPVDAMRPAPAMTPTRAGGQVAEATPKEVIEAAPETGEGLQVSRRPQPRPREIEKAEPARQATEPERKTEVRGSSGNNATRDASRGSIAGRETATATRAGHDTRNRSTEQGNAAVSNYPGQVMRHLARVPRPRAETRGAALVQFTIADGGRLASVGLARSSGSSRLDNAALTVVQRAAPFPDPPRGAQRSFSVRIEGR
ncbi:outer membrane transport energization protein TonB [Roseovarius azorensis]|uniref:Outer membrane transport energization protein TonB n=1 Tax=Roseovarius azorensis TaxID=1287727 RepID=A0A1H7LYL3_9RHOB|nr:TonB family protein [Roseovarius azorensis]SEL04021.1 outer membrane transport energization protein TonB [Roseovarius azorensis]